MGIRTKTLITTATLLVASVLLAGSAFAKSDERPGWGNGDENHVHTGPPGISVRPPGHDLDDFRELRKEMHDLIMRLRLQLFQSFFFHR